MNIPKLSHLLTAGFLTLGITALATPHAMAAEAGGSSLPPGVNPSTPAGGNGGDAQGYEKKPANPEPAGTEKQAVEKQPSAKSKTDRTHSTQKKAAPTKP
jgi:hypothetical protein